MKIIFHIDKQLKVNKKFGEIVSEETKTIKKFIRHFVFIIFSSFVTIVATFGYLAVYWTYYKYYILPKNH